MIKSPYLIFAHMHNKKVLMYVENNNGSSTPFQRRLIRRIKFLTILDSDGNLFQHVTPVPKGIDTEAYKALGPISGFISFLIGSVLLSTLIDCELVFNSEQKRSFDQAKLYLQDLIESGKLKSPIPDDELANIVRHAKTAAGMIKNIRKAL